MSSGTISVGNSTLLLSHVYVAFGVAMMLFFCLAIAMRQVRDLNDVRESHLGLVPRSYRGRRGARVSNYVRAKWRRIGVKLALLFAYGYAGTAAIFYLVSRLYFWFDPSSSAFLDSAGAAVFQPAEVPLWQFVLDQVFKGSLNDVAEVFKMNWSSVTNNPTNFYYSAGVLLFRSVIGIFTATLLILFWRGLKINIRLMLKGDREPQVSPFIARVANRHRLWRLR